MSRQGALHVATPGIPQWLSYTRPTAVIPGLAPEGRSIIECFAPVSGIAQASEWTAAMTRESVAGYIEGLRQKLPGLSIDTMRVLDPQDFATHRNLYEGALYGVAPGATPGQFFPHRLSIGGLYLAGQTTFPGYGVPAAMWSGIQAADALLHDARRNKHRTFRS
jgi:phytoene desaturase